MMEKEADSQSYAQILKLKDDYKASSLQALDHTKNIFGGNEV